MPRGKNQFPEWTENDVKFLREHYLQLPLYEIASRMSRSYRAIQAKAQRLWLYQETIENMKPLQNFTEMEKAYIAGFLDGEAFFGIRITYKNDRPVHATPMINISNTNKKIIDWLANKINFGKWTKKKPYIYPKNRYSKPWNAAYVLHISGRFRMEPFLKTFLPYFRVKREIAKKLLELYQIHPYRGPYTIQIWKKILEIRELINYPSPKNVYYREHLARFIKELEFKNLQQDT